MTEEEKAKYQNQFSGYQLPLIQLDATGPAYIKLEPHPYYTNQPAYWKKPFYSGHTGFPNKKDNKTT